nr:hypothetical protein [Tanacetum cinerariifolium]
PLVGSLLLGKVEEGRGECSGGGGVDRSGGEWWENRWREKSGEGSGECSGSGGMDWKLGERWLETRHERCMVVEGSRLNHKDNKRFLFTSSLQGGDGGACKLLGCLLGDFIEVLEVLGCLKMGQNER